MDADAEAGGLDEAFHEIHLIEADGEEEFGEFAEGFFAEVAAAVEIVSAGEIAVGEAALVFVDILGEAAGDGPDGAGVE